MIVHDNVWGCQVIQLVMAAVQTAVGDSQHLNESRIETDRHGSPLVVLQGSPYVRKTAAQCMIKAGSDHFLCFLSKE